MTPWLVTCLHICVECLYLCVCVYVCVSLCLSVCVHSVVWLLYVCLTAVHLYANYRAVAAVTMDTFNQSRLHCVISHWLSTQQHQALSLRQANQREPVFTGINTCLLWLILVEMFLIG